MGSENDGGYLLPNDFSGISVCFSPGVDVNASFEIDLLEKFSINSHLADFSVDSPPMDFKPLSFTKKFIGPFNDEKFITIDDWVRNNAKDSSGKDLLLQMDIEGAEYVSLLSVSEEVLKKFRIMVIEFHDTKVWGERTYFQMIELLFEKLQKHFHIVHNHPNNCCGNVKLGRFVVPRVFELTFLRKDRSEALGFCDEYPNKLDRPNLHDKPDLILPSHWYVD